MISFFLSIRIADCQHEKLLQLNITVDERFLIHYYYTNCQRWSMSISFALLERVCYKYLNFRDKMGLMYVLDVRSDAQLQSTIEVMRRYILCTEHHRCCALRHRRNQKTYTYFIKLNDVLQHIIITVTSEIKKKKNDIAICKVHSFPLSLDNWRFRLSMHLILYNWKDCQDSVDTS